jgi:hypothetical protein
MPAAVLVGIGAFALLSGPICGGIQWHYWNRTRGRNLWTRRATSTPSDTLSEKDESAAA